MNKVALMGRLTRDPDVRYTQGENSLCVARFTLAIDRRQSKQAQQNGQTADFPACVAFGKLGEFARKWLHKGIKVALSGRIQTRDYTRQDGVKVYVTEVVCEDIEFAESKRGQAAQTGKYGPGTDAPQADMVGQTDRRPTQEEIDGFMNIPDGIDEELPFT